MKEETLIKKALRGNAKAYGQLIELYKDTLYRTAFLHVKNEDVALDMVSETIVKGYESIRKVRKPEYFKTWLIRILLNNIHDYFRKNREFAGTDAFENSFAMQDNPMGDGVTAEERMDLANALDTLPERYKSIIILKYYEDLKISEIASSLNIPEGSVKAYLHNVKETLRAYLKEDYLYE